MNKIKEILSIIVDFMAKISSNLRSKSCKCDSDEASKEEKEKSQKDTNHYECSVCGHNDCTCTIVREN